MPAHIHAELMKQYAEDAMTTAWPWELWQVFNTIYGDWEDASKLPDWDDGRKYRRKPRTINIKAK